MTNGFFGQILWVDLSQGIIERKPVPPDRYRDVLGGYGLAVRLLIEWIPPGTDPLGPNNVLAFIPGLLTGTGVPFSGRFMVAGKSPLTGGWGDANCGGHFGPALRSAGLDGVFVTGVAPRPVYLAIDEGQAELRDAGLLWGRDTVETEVRLRKEMGRGAQALSIGPAGEQRSLIAALITDGGRAAARSGLGAVMGSKQLKAVAVRGTKRVLIHNQDELRRLGRDYQRIFQEEPSRLSRLLLQLMKTFVPLLRRVRAKPSGGPAEAIIHAYRQYGTCAGTAFSTEIGDAPVWNWRGVGARDLPLDRSAHISDDAVIQHQIKRYHCRFCPVGCGGIVRLDGERYTVEEGHKPEYETLAAFGPLLLNDDLESIIQVNTLCDRYGLDTISTGATVAFALECAENGLIERELGDELTLSWGHAAAIVELVERIARREGIGDLLADGVAAAAQRIGPEAVPFAIEAGGQELPMHDSRYEPLLGLAYAVDPTPGRHNQANGGILDAPALAEVYATAGVSLPQGRGAEGRGTLFAIMNRYLQVVNCAGLCMFSLMMGKPPVRGWINAATGWQLDMDDLLRIGHRIQVLRHRFNLREGINPLDTPLPDRARGEPPLKEGPVRGITLDMETMIEEWADAMGYDAETGAPTGETLASLGLTEIVIDRP
jgi:aldehyde:ferredoxin oxidoreductase